MFSSSVPARSVASVTGYSGVDVVSPVVVWAVGTSTSTSSVAGVGASVTIVLRPLLTSSTDRYSHGAVLDTSNTVVERAIGLPGGVLVTKRGTGDVWSYPNVHGDVSATANASGVKLGATILYDPFGQPLGGLPDNVKGNVDSGWVGSHYKLDEHETGLVPLTEMGARVYNPATGRFLQTDPVEGGTGTNDYGYVRDAVNQSDLNGMGGYCGGCKNPKRDEERKKKAEKAKKRAERDRCAAGDKKTCNKIADDNCLGGAHTNGTPNAPCIGAGFAKKVVARPLSDGAKGAAGGCIAGAAVGAIPAAAASVVPGLGAVVEGSTCAIGAAVGGVGAVAVGAASGVWDFVFN